MKFTKVMRLIWIDSKACTEKGVGRRDVMRAFGLSVSAASMDLSAYSKLSNGKATYDPYAKVWKASGPIFSVLGRIHVTNAVFTINDAQKDLENYGPATDLT